MYHLVSIGDITIDLFFQGNSLTEEKDRFSLALGGKYYTDSFHQSLGGSGANIAIHAANLGINSAVMAKAGENAFKNIIVQNLVRKTVSTEFLYFNKNHVSISTILLSKNGEKTVVKHSDPKEHFETSSVSIERISKSSIIFMGNLPDIPLKERIDLIKKVRSDDNLVSLNFGSKDCSKKVKGMKSLIEVADILFLNRYEFAELVSKKPDKLDLNENYQSKLKSKDIMLVITDGADGSYVHTKDKVYHQKAITVKKVVDTTGAGDAYTTAFLVKYNETNNIETSMEFAADYASKVLTKIGAH